MSSAWGIIIQALCAQLHPDVSRKGAGSAEWLPDSCVRDFVNYRLRLLLHCGVPWQMKPHHETARSLPTFRGVESLNRLGQQLQGCVLRPLCTADSHK